MSREDAVLVYDGECGVCTRAARWVAARGPVELRTFAETEEDELARLPADWRRCAHLLMEKRVYSCGEAMERAFRLTGHPATSALGTARHLPGYARFREFCYRQFADRRGLVGRYLG